MLDLSGVSHTYPNGTRALDDVTLSIPKGMFGLLGPNGAGKSTLMRTIATLQAPTAGSIRFGDIDVLAEPDRLRRKLGYLPQDFGVYPRISAYQMLDHMAVLKGIADAKDRKLVVEHLLEQTNLWAVRSKAIAGFSGGMRQRFGIAQALIGNPELIIVDEPTAGLDPEERNRFLNLLAGIGENVVVILSTHIVDDVADLCPRMAVLAGGRLQLEGVPRDLIRSTRGQVWQRTIPHQQLPAMQEQHQVISHRFFAGEIVVHVLSDTQPEGFAPVEGGLEDVYFATLAQTRRAAAIAST
ncbi:ABC transporter ATP-binding protein [Novosphingobium sp.]|jgi:ABC-type multidrug transport system ATPase subunit|uniref:ABC transporter ATP-binding protein n=1 Tax=Novosphingobium sp. TaxID=1874826 RepID=UPI0022BCA117|nr:ABC transporter ATP-binding protein [Novosphingobium sp.]MCZ8073776.1 ABC transporter ATP-binding protein [Roseateles sp.]MCZ8085405.1 ABC transporter ATP-binding protein [Paracoccaceae bacterium]MCZ8227593.1 ABC transporter ATP-binding protein [Burkholderiaceae bacterium]MCZ8036533.1 ABC transporter ATP-binding protein [Novosphingobium sp.]MCZ8233504.1 ABC transporter ATP-binding protein [Novosphingobium sp.]